MEINKDELRIWIAALRSGKYQQTTKTLQDKVGYCCLGVACRVLIPEDKLLLTKTGLLAGGMPAEQPHAPEWLKDINCHVTYNYSFSIISLNDGDEKSFIDIANFLEENFLNDTPTTNT